MRTRNPQLCNDDNNDGKYSFNLQAYNNCYINYIITNLHIQQKSMIIGLESVISHLVVPFLEDVVKNTYAEDIYFPLHCDDHWTLVSLTYPSMRWSYVDSLRPRRSTVNNNSSLETAYSPVYIFCFGKIV